jgi:hypothetical protein
MLHFVHSQCMHRTFYCSGIRRRHLARLASLWNLPVYRLPLFGELPMSLYTQNGHSECENKSSIHLPDEFDIGIIRPGPPQYRHRRVVQCCCFLGSDNGPSRRVVSISIWVGPSIELGRDTCGRVATTEAYVCSSPKRNVSIQNVFQIRDYHIAQLN